MSSFITNAAHAIANAWAKLKSNAQHVEQVTLPVLQKLNADDAMITATANASGVPFVKQACRVEESLVGWAIKFIDDQEAAGSNPSAVLGSLVADIKTIAPTIKAAAMEPIAAPPSV
jgi:hypothetical protein